MERIKVLLAVVMFACASLYASNIVVNDNFESGMPAGATAAGGAAIVADPLGGGSNVLYIPQGGSLVWNDESMFDTDMTPTSISFDAYLPNVNSGWWDLAVGKGGAGCPRIFLNNGGDGNLYFRAYANFSKADGTGIYNLPEVGLWGNPLQNNRWYNLKAEVVNTQIGGEDAIALRLYLDGVLLGQSSTLDMFGTSPNDKPQLSDDPFNVGFGNNFSGYIDNLVVEVPEPCTIAILGIGGMIIRRFRRC